MFRTAVWLFQLPYHFDRTGVRVMTICPGVTDTALISEAHRRMLREEWGVEIKKDIDKLFKQKWVLVIKEWPFLHSSYTSDIWL
jgi:NAD(P)-dependent dehydrogenase (short-subunit alcohol dehydrogenase family)